MDARISTTILLEPEVFRVIQAELKKRKITEDPTLTLSDIANFFLSHGIASEKRVKTQAS